VSSARKIKPDDFGVFVDLSNPELGNLLPLYLISSVLSKLKRKTVFQS
jgi:hypothetical protein